MANATTVILMQKTLSYTAGTHLTTHLDLETGCMGRSRSLKMAPFDRPYYDFLLVHSTNIALSCTVCSHHLQLFQILRYINALNNNNKGIDAYPSHQFVAVQSPGVHCRKMQCSSVPTPSSAVAKRPRDASYHRIFC